MRPPITKVLSARKKDAAEALAVNALAWLAGEHDRLKRFLDLSGLAPSDVRRVAAEPGFLAAVLDHIASDEGLASAFVLETGLRADDLGRARAELGPPERFA
jgi:hypothetical protein